VAKVLKSDVHKGSDANLEAEVAILMDLRHPNTILFIAALTDHRSSSSPSESTEEHNLREKYEESTMGGKIKLFFFKVSSVVFFMF